MALPHARSLQVVSLAPPGAALESTVSHAILKAGQLEAMRLVLRAGEQMQQHDAPGEATLQCLEGEVLLELPGRQETLRPGDWLHLPPRVHVTLRARQPYSLLLTICLLAG